MHREIKINYDRLEALTGKIQTYQSALARMKESVARIFEILEGSSGKAYEVLLKRKDTIAQQMAQKIFRFLDLEHILLRLEIRHILDWEQNGTL